MIEELAKPGQTEATSCLGLVLGGVCPAAAFERWAKVFSKLRRRRFCFLRLSAREVRDMVFS